jgi:NADH-quinone oxidoreductase subunit G
VLTGAMVSQRVFDAVPMYAGLSLDALAGHGMRWPDREAAAGWPAADHGPFELEAPPSAASPNGALRLGSFRSIWAGPEVSNSPALKFLHHRALAELSPADAQRLQVADGDRVVVAHDGDSVEATVALRAAMPDGSVFVEGTAPPGGLAEVRRA